MERVNPLPSLTIIQNNETFVKAKINYFSFNLFGYLVIL